MQRFLLTFLFLPAFLCGHSQQAYKGKLVSALTGKPLRSAEILQAGNYVSFTDTLGNFTISLDTAENSSLVVFAFEVGWVHANNLNFKKDDVLTISLMPECQYSFTADSIGKNFKLIRPANAFSARLTKQDHAFEKKYKLAYYGYGDGCTGIVSDCVESYNKAMAAYLDQRFGKAWRKEVNGDVPGL